MKDVSHPPSQSFGVAGGEAATEELRALKTGALDLAKFPHAEPGSIRQALPRKMVRRGATRYRAGTADILSA